MTPANKIYEYPVNALHSTVLGYSAKSERGRQLWEELDWRVSWKDLGQHVMNPTGGEYLHVRCKYNPDQDGPQPCPIEHRRWYRVRCLHEIGTRWRGGRVQDVRVVRRDGQWLWQVEVRKDA